MDMPSYETTVAFEVLDEEEIQSEKENQDLDIISRHIDEMSDDSELDWECLMTPHETTSASEVLDEGKYYPIDSSRLTEPPKPPSETMIDKEIDEETDEDELTLSPLAKKKEDDKCRSLQEEFAVLTNKSLKVALLRWKEGVSCSICPYVKEDSDYLCTNVLHTWPELRKTHSYNGVIDAGLAVARMIDATDYTGMIERRIVCGPGFLKLKLSMKWIAQSIFKIIKGDIAAWAPKLPVKKAIIYFILPKIAEEMHTGHLRSTVIGETLTRILEYSGVEVIRRFHEGDDLDHKGKIFYDPYISATLDLLREKGLTVKGAEDSRVILIEGQRLPLVDLTALWHALNMVKADWIVHVTDVGQRDYFEMCIIAAKRAGWIVNDYSPCPLRHAGLGLTKVVSLVNLFEEAKIRCKAILVGQVEKLEHTAEALGYGAVKYAVLKANRLSNYTINFDEILNEKEDTVIYLQYTHAQICSILKKYKRPIQRLKESELEDVKDLVLKNSEERELGLHLLRFTEVLGEVCEVLMPHILCEYLYDLCKKFDKLHSSVCQILDGNDNSKLLLCEATAKVMRKCFKFLGITPIYKKIFKVPPVAETATRVPFSDPTEEPLLKVPPAAEPATVVFFSNLTEEQLMAFFFKGPCFRFELCNVLLRHNIDDMVENGSSYAELRLFGIIQAETHISDPSHHGSINIFERNFDDPLVFINPGSLSPHDIFYCSFSVSTFVRITAKVYGTTYKGEGMESVSDYTECYLSSWELKMDKDKYLEGLKEFLFNDILPSPEEHKEDVYIDDDAFQVCDDHAFINFSEYFANKPNGGSGSCKLKGKDGYIELYYVALKYAVEATLEVDFAASSQETKVFGRVMAYYGKNFCYGCPPAEKDLYSAMLFKTEPDNNIFVEPGKIDLTRSVLGVPAQYSLIIDANLCDFTSGDIILSGVWEFLVPADGRVCNGLLEGNECSLKLKVDWKLPPDALEFSSLFS